MVTGPALDLINYLFKASVVPDAEEITNCESTEQLFHLVTTKAEVPDRLANSLTEKQK
jgi:hypothetical protein